MSHPNKFSSFPPTSTSATSVITIDSVCPFAPFFGPHYASTRWLHYVMDGDLITVFVVKSSAASIKKCFNLASLRNDLITVFVVKSSDTPPPLIDSSSSQ